MKKSYSANKERDIYIMKETKKMNNLTSSKEYKKTGRISFNNYSNNKNNSKANIYESLCKELMKENNLKDFSSLKAFLKNHISSSKQDKEKINAVKLLLQQSKQFILLFIHVYISYTCSK